MGTHSINRRKKRKKMNLGTNLLRYFLITLNTIFMLFATGMFVTAILGEVYYRDYFDVVSGQAVLEGLLGTACFYFYHFNARLEWCLQTSCQLVKSLHFSMYNCLRQSAIDECFCPGLYGQVAALFRECNVKRN